MCEGRGPKTLRFADPFTANVRFEMSEAGPPAKPFSELPPHAQRALLEAEARRRQFDERAGAQPRPSEQGGRRGPEPTRYGDWEKDGIASDF